MFCSCNPKSEHRYLLQTSGKFLFPSSGTSKWLNTPYQPEWASVDEVQNDQLVKQKDDWVIEETNFCLGRMFCFSPLPVGEPGAQNIPGLQKLKGM